MRLLSPSKKSPELPGSPSGSAANLRRSAEGAGASTLDSSNPFAEDDPFHSNPFVSSSCPSHLAVEVPRRSPLHEVPLFDTPSSGSAAGVEAGSSADYDAFLPPTLPLGNPFLSATPLTLPGSPLFGSLPQPGRAASAYEEQGVSAFQVEDSSERVHASDWGRSKSWGRAKGASAGAGGGDAAAGGGAAPGREGSSRRSLSSIGASDAWGSSDVLPSAGPATAKKSFRLPWGRKEAAPPPLALSAAAPPFSAILPPPANGWDSSRAGDREAALNLRERELSKREAEVARREAAAARAGGRGGQPKNWPRCRPILHHDISGEIPPTRQALVRTAYLTWCLIATAYLYNWLIITILFATREKNVSLWLFASLVAGFGVPLSFLCWYRSLYFAAIKDSAAHWAWYFLHMAINFVWDWWMFVGIEPHLGGFSAGLFTMIEQFSHGGGKGSVFGVLSIINMVLWGLGALLSFSLLGWGMRAFRGRDRQTVAPPPAAVASSGRA